MKSKFINLCLLTLLVLFISCSSGFENESIIPGKWSLAGRMVGDSPSSFWFRGNGYVTAPWEKHKSKVKSRGEYEFIDDTHIKISIYDGHYKGRTYFYEIIKLDKQELVFKDATQRIKMRRI